jgi:hypothetical protein
MNEMTVLYTASGNSHYLTADGQHLACAPSKPLPKKHKLRQQNYTYVACHRCNGCNWNR